MGFTISSIILFRRLQISQIKRLLQESDIVRVFDVDGVLALQEWGEYNHFDLSDEEWAIKTKSA